jgi:hypothetical protein
LFKLAFLPAVNEVSFVPASFPTFIVGGDFEDSYSNRDEVES